MQNIILFDTPSVRENLLPITFTRPIAAIRQGILTYAEKWQIYLPGKYSWQTVEYLSEVFRYAPSPECPTCLFIAGHIAPDNELAEAVAALTVGECLFGENGELIAAHTAAHTPFAPETCETLKKVTYTADYHAIRTLIDIFEANGEALRRDFDLITRGRESQPVSTSNTIIGPRENLFIEEGARMEGAIINVEGGPVYLAHGAEVMEGACIRGGLCAGPHSHVNMGAKVYGPTTLGPHCKIGGEVNNAVFIGYSNKAHDGFLGNAVIGEWCNLGGGTTASNLKNDYTEIKLWNYPLHRFARTGRQFCGLIMGDHSKAGINTMFNTATVVGVGANIHGTGFPRNFVPSFTEGSPTSGFTDVNPTRFIDIARRVMSRRDITLTEAEERMYVTLYDITERYR